MIDLLGDMEKIRWRLPESVSVSARLTQKPARLLIIEIEFSGGYRFSQAFDIQALKYYYHQSIDIESFIAKASVAYKQHLNQTKEDT